MHRASRAGVTIEQHGKLGEFGLQVLDAPKRIGQLQGHGAGLFGCLRFIDWIAFGHRRRVAPGRCLRGRNGVAKSVDTGLYSVICPAVQEP